MHIGAFYDEDFPRDNCSVMFSLSTTPKLQRSGKGWVLLSLLFQAESEGFKKILGELTVCPHFWDG